MTETILDEAAAWVTRLHAGAPSAAVRAEFDTWVGHSPQHIAAYEAALRTWLDLEEMRRSEQYKQLLGSATRREQLVSFLRRPRLPLLAATAAFVVVLGIFTVLRAPTLFHRPVRVETRLAEIREVTLPDGTHVTLGAQSRLSYEFTPDARSATLAGGDAFFAVTKDPGRPFYVSIGDVRVRVVGTQFEVRRRTDEVSVAVAEGVVEVTRGGEATAETRVLRRGQSLVARRSAQLAGVHEVDTDDLGAWRAGRLVYDNAELRDVIADASRYTRERIVIEEPQLAATLVTTSFRTSQIDEMLETLQSALPITTERLSNGDILLRTRR